ncbi:FAD-dependent monooxygenase [Streptomyces mirabilis]|uniref:FAD-dependent monooxygenase n=1 Tax=Streptomyces mirabilis TaxID=68239 RepID=UPI003674A178
MIICGTGAAGLTLAIDLARRNVGFLLIDKAAHPFIGSRGKGIQPRSQEVFEDLDVIDRIVASGGEYPVQRFHTDEGPVDKAVVEMSDPTPASRTRSRCSSRSSSPSAGCGNDLPSSGTPRTTATNSSASTRTPTA